MKRIIIPAGTVSGKKDYILEIPIDSNDQDENAIYILDDKSSRGSMKSLSDYFYDRESSQLNQEYMKQFLYQDQTQPYINQSNDDLPDSYPPNYMLKQEYNQHIENQRLSDISQSAKYQYYKSLGFTESELYKLLAKNAGQRVVQVPSQRKQMRFNKLGVSDFTSLDDDPQFYQYGSFTKPINTTVGNVNVGAYANIMANPTYSEVPYTPSTSFGRTQRYYEDYVRENQSVTPNVDTRVYKQYSTTLRPPMSPSKNNTLPEQSYNVQQNVSSPRTSNQQMRTAYYQPRYYSKPIPSAKVDNSSKTVIENSASKNQANSNESNNYQNPARTVPHEESIDSNVKMGNYQKLSQNSVRQIPDPQKRMYRTLPGTNFVSNVPNIRIRNPVAS